MSANQVALWYLVASVCFILALKGLSHPSTARRGNALGIAGMAIAVVVTLALVYSTTRNVGMILAGIAVGGTIGAVVAKRVQMTQMPELVAAMHSLVGLAAVLIAVAAINNPVSFGLPGGDPDGQQARALHRHLHRRDHVLRVGHRLRQAVGPHQERAGRLRRPAPAQPRAGDRDDRLRHLVLHGRRLDAVHRDDGDRVPARRADHHPHRRRRHAGGDLDAEQLLGLGGGRHRLLAQQPDADHRRVAGRLLRRDPLVHHVQGDEPQLLLASSSAASARRRARRRRMRRRRP